MQLVGPRRAPFTLVIVPARKLVYGPPLRELIPLFIGTVNVSHPHPVNLVRGI